MVGRRLLFTALRSSTSWKNLNVQQPRIQSYCVFSRPLSSLRSPLEPPPKSPLIINKRHSSNHTGSGPSLSSRFFGALGTLLAIGGGSIYTALKDKDSIFGKYYYAACDKASEDVAAEVCGAKKPDPCPPAPCEDCIEKKCENSACLRKLECEEQLISKANADLERALKDTKGKAVEYTEVAMKAYCEAIVVVCEYLNHSYCTIDNDELESPLYEETWCCIFEVAKNRCAKVKDALQKGQCAWELLCRLREVIDNGKACKYTSCNPLLVTAEEALICAERELLTLKAKLDCVASEHDMVKAYSGVIDSFRAELKVEVDALIATMECCDIKYAEQEMALMIEQAYKKVVRLQKQMANSLVCAGKVPEHLANTCC